MTPLQLMDYIQKHCIDVRLMEYYVKLDRVILSYTLNGTKYSMQFENISDITTHQQAESIVQMIQANIEYHMKEQEQEKE